MQNLKATIRKIGALASGALMMGATLGMVSAFDLADFPSPFVSNGNIASQIVVGSGAMTADVVGGIQIAERLGNLAITSEEKTATAATGSASVSVTGGESLDTANTKLYLGDAINSAKTTITKNELPNLLASGTLSVSGVDYTYDQYLVMGSRTVTFGKSGESIDPVMYVDSGTGGTNVAAPLYTARVVFNKLLNISNSRVQGKTLTLFNKDYTIGSGSDYNTLILYGYGVTDQFTHGVEQTVTVGGTDYVVKAVVDTSSNVAFTVNGVSDGSTYAQGESTTLEGLNIYIKSVFYASSTDLTQNYATLSLGSEKISLDTANKVKTGTSLTSVDGTYVTNAGTSGSGISKLEIAVAAPDATGDYIAKGNSFVDPVFGSFKVAFGGVSPDLEDAGRSQTYLATSGDNAQTLKFTDYRGYEKTLSIGYDNDTVTGTVTPTLTDTNARVYHVIEGEAVPENEYVLLSQGDFSHIFQVTNIDDVGDSSGTPEVELTDMMSGDKTTIYLEAPGYTNATAYIDGLTYFVNATSAVAKFTWNADSTDTATFGSTGNITTLFPLIKGANGEFLTFLNNVSTQGLANGNLTTTYYEVPGGSAGTTIVGITNATTSVSAGRITYALTNGMSTSNITTIGGVLPLLHPMVLLLEEKGKNSGGSEVRDAIIAIGGTSGTAPMKMGWSSTVVYTDASAPATNYKDNMIGDTYTYKTVDRYGAFVKQYTYEQGTITIYYPDEQSIAAVAVGEEPVITIGGGSTDVTYTESTQGDLLANAAWLDTEVTPSIKSDNNLILIGGPAINTLVADLSAQEGSTVWDLDTWRDGAHDGMAQVVLVEDAFVSGKVALVVAGHSADDTRSASKAVATYDVAPFSDKAATGVSEITLTSAEYPS